MSDSREGKSLNSTEVGGHGGIIKEGNKIGKAVQGAAEPAFYDTLAARGLPEDVMDFFPPFHGYKEIDGVKYLLIDDLTAGMEKPCIMDLKMGTSTVGEDAKPEKRAAMEEKDKSTTTTELGMRLTGNSCWKVNTQTMEKKGKDITKKIKKDELEDIIKDYFHNGEKLRADVIALAVEKLKKILNWFKTTSLMRFYSASLLFSYDGANDSPQGFGLKIIDFAHVFDIKDGGHDDGFIFGLEILIGYLEKLL